MKRIGSVQASVVAFVLLLAYHGKVECGSMGISGQTNATIPAQIHRKMRATYREPELPIFGTTEEDESRMSGHNSRNQSRDDEDGYRHQRPVTKSIKKSSSSSSKKSSSKKSGGSSASIKSSSSKKSSKRGGSLFATAHPSSLPSMSLVPTTTMVPMPSGQPSMSMMPTNSSAPSTTMPSISEAPSLLSPTRRPTPFPTRLVVTNAPSSAGAFPIEVSTYSLFFFFDDSTGDISTTDQDFLQLGETTRLFLDDYFDDKYGRTVIITFDQVLTQVVGFSSITLPIQTFFFTTVLFSENSIFYPPRSEIQREVEKAFSTFGSNFEYLMAIRGLPSSNPFQAISSVNWGGYSTG